MACNQQGCSAPAAVHYVWPTDGQQKRSCAEHGDKARAVLGAIGFGLELKPLICESCLAELGRFAATSADELAGAGDFCFMCGRVVPAA